MCKVMNSVSCATEGVDSTFWCCTGHNSSRLLNVFCYTTYLPYEGGERSGSEEGRHGG